MTVHRNRESEPLRFRKISMTAAQEERLDRMVADRDTSLSKLLVSTALAPRSPMSAAEARNLAASLMQVRDEMNSLLVAFTKAGAPVDQEYVDLAEDLNRRLYNMTEDQVR